MESKLLPDSTPGLIPATFTPFLDSGEVDLETIPAMVDQLISRGVAGIYVNGTTGEGPSLTTPERKRLTEAFVAAAAGRIPVIVQVGHNSLGEARDLAAHAQAAGANAVSATPPGYFRAESVEALTEVVAEIAAGAPDLPFFYYHIPAFGGVALDMTSFAEAAVGRVPNFRGIKFSSPNLHEFDRCRRAANGQLEVYFGVDEMLLAGLAMGVQSAVGSTYNFAPELYLELIEAFKMGDIAKARDLQSQSVDMIHILVSSCGRAGLKAAMTLSGIPCGRHRLPISDPTQQQLATMEQQLNDAGFLRWIRR
ncbi:MAG: dihydrodipicolinate synthase family protein [Verrucomicrobia bacterium]|nr:dihydrodipicolinate synthase family protein [Verrucomicrobiota bacterium]